MLYSALLTTAYSPPFHISPPSTATTQMPNLISRSFGWAMSHAQNSLSTRTSSSPHSLAPPARNTAGQVAAWVSRARTDASRSWAASSTHTQLTGYPFRRRSYCSSSSFSPAARGRRCRRRPACTLLHIKQLTLAVEPAEDGFVVVYRTSVKVGAIAMGNGYSILRMVKRRLKVRAGRAVLIR
jgi:hypothetical protein